MQHQITSMAGGMVRSKVRLQRPRHLAEFVKSLVLLLTVGLSTLKCNGQDFVLNRRDLNRPIGKTGLFLDLKISPLLSEKFVVFTILENEQVSPSGRQLEEQLKRQRSPDLVSWMVGDNLKTPEIKWLCGVVTNRDSTLHTIAKLPTKDWRRSYLVFEFNKGKLASRNEQRIRIFLSLSEMDLESKFEYQSQLGQRD